MNLTDEAFEDFLKHVIPFIQPNEVLDCPLRETNEYKSLVKMLPDNSHVLWNRVVLNYSALRFEHDIAFYGIFQDDLINNLENLLPDTLVVLYYYYFSIDLRTHKLIEEFDEYYYTNESEKIPFFHIEKSVCSAVSLDYIILHNYIKGFLEGKSSSNK